MTEALAQQIVSVAGLYLLAGSAVALVFIFGGAGRIDPAARGGSLRWRVRLLITPGIIALWPLMLCKLLRGSQPPVA
ncbi:MAG: hypothetical protein AAGA84_03805 [Pseudomonadota bacterium]